MSTFLKRARKLNFDDKGYLKCTYPSKQLCFRRGSCFWQKTTLLDRWISRNITISVQNQSHDQIQCLFCVTLSNLPTFFDENALLWPETTCQDGWVEWSYLSTQLKLEFRSNAYLKSNETTMPLTKNLLKLYTDSVSVNKMYLTDSVSVNKKYLTDSICE